MFSEERRQLILNQLIYKGRVIAKELADEFSLSIDSIRRDLTIMEEKGLLKRTHGGAIPMAKARTEARPNHERYGNGTKYDHAIAKAASSYINPGDTVFMGSAGIHYTMLSYLPSNIRFTVVTNCLVIADKLKDVETIETYFVGGKLKKSGNVTDSIANEFIRQFTFDTVFVTGGGISSRGISTATPEVASFGRAVSEVSRMKICLAPHYKVGMNLFAQSLGLKHIDIFITDEETEKQHINDIEAMGIKVVVAN
ncbi:DeoR/GlpR family DNA-binding transcription regulator [Rossellomorea sp. BNER]|uniref:DeoR/GlpR family DNA-binding transcription regulator n=1 Tax=Rossellomorea sp. BNER TaxID=2962031 RepID=UPI003AF1F162|nr:DeoR/GlpR family DNA-binding transcription regulator [Rossellomorea sp. BNER]